MFCTKCGEKLEEDSKFCVKCGTLVNTELVPTAPLQARTFGGVQPEQMKVNTAQGISNQVNSEIQAGHKETPTPASQSTEYRCPNCGKSIPSLNINLNDGTAFCSCGKKDILAKFLPPQQTVLPSLATQYFPPSQNNLPIFALISIILLAIGTVASFITNIIIYPIDYNFYKSIIGGINNLYNLTRTGGYIIGIFAFVKIKKNIGNTICYIVSILLGVQVLINIFYLIKQ